MNLVISNSRIWKETYSQMKYHIHSGTGKAAYLQLYEQLRRDIVSGVLPLGGKLPSKRLLAEEMEGVMSLTVPLVAQAHSGGNWLEAKE